MGVQVIQRAVSVKNILQRNILAFARNGKKYLKSCNFDGVDDYASTADIARDTIRSAITGNALPTTFYMKIKLPSSIANSTVYGMIRIGKTDSTNPLRSRIGFYFRVTSTGKVGFYFATTPSDSDTTAIGSFSGTVDAVANGIYSIACVFGHATITNAANIGYINAETGNLSASVGTTLVRPEDLANENHAIYFNKAAYNDNTYYVGIMIDAAIFPSAKTLTECQADILTAPFRIPFRDGQGTTLTNSGTYGATANLTTSGITAETFYTLIETT